MNKLTKEALKQGIRELYEVSTLEIIRGEDKFIAEYDNQFKPSKIDECILEAVSMHDYCIKNNEEINLGVLVDMCIMKHFTTLPYETLDTIAATKKDLEETTVALKNYVCDDGESAFDKITTTLPTSEIKKVYNKLREVVNKMGVITESMIASESN